MANMMKMMQQAAGMRKQMKKMQKELEKKVVEVKSNNGKVTVSARGDMTIKAITIDPSVLEDLKLDRLEKILLTTVNAALNAAKKTAGTEMSKMQGGLGGLSDMLGNLG
ncbi:MAG: YbaB/EbfC family nucleoid-associated protein [Kiritimatiellia bacterium]